MANEDTDQNPPPGARLAEPRAADGPPGARLSSPDVVDGPPGARPAEPSEQGLGAFGTMRDIGRGVIAAPVTLAQGIVELGALGADLAFDTDYARGVTEAFEGFKGAIGATPEGTAGQVTDELLAFGLGFIPVAGWLGRASAVARGTTGAAAAPKSLFMRTATEFGNSARGKAMLGTRTRLAATTAVAAGGYEAITSPDGYGTVADAFDALPEFMRSEAASDDVTGRDDALRRLRNRLRRGGEAATFSAGVDAALAGAGRVAPAIMEVPGVGPAIAGSLRATRSLFNSAADVVGRVPGTQSLNEGFRKWFTASGNVDRRMAEANFDRLAFSDTARREAVNYFRGLDDATDNLFTKLNLPGQGTKAAERARRDVTEYLQGNYNALQGYDASVREAADRMQRLTFEYEDQLLAEIEREIARYAGGRGPAQRGPQALGLKRLEEVRREILEQRELAQIKRDGIRQMRQQAGEALKGFEDSQSTYLRRRFEMYEAPERFYRQMDAAFMESPLFKRAVQEVVDNTQEALTVPEAQQKVLGYIGLDLMADGGLTAEEALRRRALTANKERIGEQTITKSSDINILESMFVPREALLDDSPSLRALMGEITDPQQLYIHTISDLAETVANVRFARSLVDGGFVKAGAEATEALARGGRPMFVDPGDVRGALPQQTVPEGRPFEVERVGGGRRPRSERVTTGTSTPGAIQDVIKQNQEVLRNYGYKPLGETADPNHPFMGVYGELTGTWAPPEVHAALNTFGRLGQTNAAEAFALGAAAKALSQQMTVVMNPLSQIRNVMGNFYFLAGNANLGRNLDVYDSLRMVTGTIADLDDAAAQRLAREMGQLGVVDTALATSQIAAMKRMGKDLNLTGRVQQTMDKVAKHTPFLGKVHQFLNRTYSDVDTVFKVANTLGEESKFMTTLSKAGLDDTNPAVRQAMIDNGLAVREALDMNPTIPFRRIYAAEVTKDVMPTYNRVGRAVRAADMTPFFGAFTSFASENIRNSGNTLMRGMREMGFTLSPELRNQLGEEAARAFETAMRAQGAARLTSFLTVAGVAPVAASAMSARVVGMSDADVSAAYQQMPPYVGGHALMFTDFDRASGKVEYVDQSYVNPYAFTTDGVRAALRAYERSGTLDADTMAQIASSVWAGIGSYAEPFGTESLVFERLRDVLPSGWVGRGGETPTGARIYGDAEGLGDRLSKSFNHVVGGFLPGYFREIAQPRQGTWAPGRLTRAMSDIPGPQGQDFNLQEEAARLVSGYTPMVLDLKRDFWYNGAEYSSLRTEAKGIATNIIKRNDSTEAQMVDAWQGYIDNLYRHQSALYADVLAARQLGLSDSDIIRQLRQKANLGSTEAALIMRGRFYPTGPSKELIRDIRLEVVAEGQARLVERPPFVQFQRMANEQVNRPLSPQVGIDAREQRRVNPVDALRQSLFGEPAAPAADAGALFGEPAAPQGAALSPAPQQAAPAQPIQPDAAPPPAGASPARQTPGLLGTNPVDILRNMELAQRTGGG